MNSNIIFVPLLIIWILGESMKLTKLGSPAHLLHSKGKAQQIVISLSEREEVIP